MRHLFWMALNLLWIIIFICLLRKEKKNENIIFYSSLLMTIYAKLVTLQMKCMLLSIVMRRNDICVHLRSAPLRLRCVCTHWCVNGLRWASAHLMRVRACACTYVCSRMWLGKDERPDADEHTPRVARICSSYNRANKGSIRLKNRGFVALGVFCVCVLAGELRYKCENVLCCRSEAGDGDDIACIRGITGCTRAYIFASPYMRVRVCVFFAGRVYACEWHFPV